jgi:enoyl-[acyl-carrier-protein] reductase (NADH)
MNTTICGINCAGCRRVDGYRSFRRADRGGSRAPGHLLVTIGDDGAMAAGLASDFARNVTGSIASVDAGYHVMS